jgi:hypothetical protein
LALAFAASTAASAPADEKVLPVDRRVTANDFGGIGLLQTRTARFAPDGQFDFGASVVDPYIRYYLTWSILPWAEATFRYSDVRNRLFSDVPAFSGDQTFKDRGADLKIRLVQEGRYVPQIALGLQDGLGTGQFQGEYLVLSKRWYDLDFSFGVGWGYFANGSNIRNPLRLISEKFRQREDVSLQGGTLRLRNYFAGESIGLFGGVEWHTPIEGLSLKLEYDPNDYQTEPLQNRFVQDVPINVAAMWRPFSFVDLSFGLERGNTFMLRLALRANLHDSGPPKVSDPAPAQIKPRPPPAAEYAMLAPDRPWWETADPQPLGLLAAWQMPDAQAASGHAAPVAPASAAVASDGDVAAQLFDRLEREGVEIEAVELSRTDATVTVSRLAGRRVVALNRVAQAVVAAVADPLERVTVVETAAGRETRRLTVVTRDVAEAAIVDYVFDGFEAAGLPVESVELSESEAVIAVAAPRGLDGVPAAALIGRVLDAVPMPVSRVTILARQGGRETGRVSVARDEARREARLDQLFAVLRSAGVEPLSIDLSHHEATLEVAAGGKTPDLRAIGRSALEALPTPLEAITVVAMAGGREVGRTTYEPFAARPTIAAGNEPPAVAPLLPDAAKRTLALAIFAELDTAGFRAVAFDVDRRGATIWVSPLKYRQVPRNIGRAARIVANHLPREVERITVALIEGEYEVGRVGFMRGDLERAVALRGSPEEVFAKASFAAGEPRRPAGAIEKPGLTPRFDWGLRPFLVQSVGQPEQFYLYQVNARLTARADLGYGVGLDFAGNRSLFGTLDKARTDSDATLPHVRSDIRRYVQQARTNIERLSADFRFQPMRNWYAKLNAGIFEDMFAGFGGEALYWPYGLPVAIGGELHWVQQRGFKEKFDFRDYSTTTGFVNMYWQMPWYGLVAQASIGRYLAGDFGVTYTLTREFESGVKVGAFMTLTDVPFDVFGEGSFDKGFFVTIPFETFLTSSTRRVGALAFRPLVKDGGQMLVGAGQQLFNLVATDNYFATVHDWRRLLD